MVGFWIGMLAIGSATLAVGIVAWLKGTLGFVRAVSHSTWERRGEQWVQYTLLEPILFLPFAFIAAAFQLARPNSRWARWFYSERRLRRARERYPQPGLEPVGRNMEDHPQESRDIEQALQR